MCNLISLIMIGALIGAGLSIAGSVAGGIAGRKARDKQKDAIERQKQENEAWYNRRYNEDATQRADAQRLLQLTEERIRQRNKAAAGTQAVVGGTEASVAATKEANAQALSGAVGQIAAAGEARKDAIEQEYRGRKAELEGASAQMEAQKGANVAAATQGVLGAAGNIAEALDGIPPKPSVQSGGVNLSTEPLEHGLSRSSAASALSEAQKEERDRLNNLKIR